MTANPVTIHDRAFPSVTEAIEFIRTILNSVPINNQVSNDDEAYVRAVLHMHPDAAQKLASGEPDYFEVRYSLKHPGTTRCFFAVCDGEAVDFSYRTAITSAGRKLGLEAAAKIRPAASIEGAEK